MLILLRNIALIFVLSLGLTPALAHDYKIGDLVIDHPALRLPPPNARVTGGYFLIRNNGDKADRLVSATSIISKRTELHIMTMENDVMKMRELENGIEIPAGESVRLQPGGQHLMFMGMEAALAEGEKHQVELVFEQAGSLTVEFVVEKTIVIEDDMPGMDMDHSGHGKKES